MSVNVTIQISAGNILRTLLAQNIFKEKVPSLFSLIIIEVIKKPEITKNTSTPTNPPWIHSKFIWKRITGITAIALNPSISGLYIKLGK